MKKISINVLLFVVVLLVCFFLAEMLLRFLFPVEYAGEHMHVLTDHGVFSRLPNFEFVYARPGNEFVQKIKLNSRGLRDHEHEYNKDKSTCRILMVGDSYTDGFQVSPEETIPKQLEMRLNKTGKFEVINFGFGGYGLVPEAVLTEEEGMKYGPDVIILNYYVGNDLNKIGYGAYQSFPDSFWVGDNSEIKNKLRERSIGLELRSFLRRNSMLYYLMKRAAATEEDSKESAAPNEAYLRDYSEDLSKNVHTTELIFQHLKQLTQKNNAAFIVVVIPAKEQVEKKLFDDLARGAEQKYDLEKPQRLIAEITGRLGIPRIDLLPSLRIAGQADKLYWVIDGHMNSKGYAASADVILKELNNLRLTGLCKVSQQ